jgi:hypothetical protein
MWLVRLKMKSEEVKIKVIPVTGRGGPYVCPVRYEHYIHIQK